MGIAMVGWGLGGPQNTAPASTSEKKLQLGKKMQSSQMDVTKKCI